MADLLEGTEDRSLRKSCFCFGNDTMNKETLKRFHHILPSPHTSPSLAIITPDLNDPLVGQLDSQWLYYKNEPVNKVPETQALLTWECESEVGMGV